MTLVQISNGEAGSSVRTKLNNLIAFRNTFPNLSAEAAALIAAMDAQPTSARQTIINDGFAALNDNNLLGKIGWLSVEAAHEEQASRLNWVNPSQSLSFTSFPEWIRNYGRQGDGQSSFFSTGVALNAMPNFSQDSACMGVYVPDNTGPFIGLDLGVSSSYISALSTNAMAARANHAGGSAQTVSEATAFGWSYWAREDASGYYMGRNLDTPVLKTVASEAVSNAIVQVGKVGTTTYCGRPQSLVVIGNMTAAEMQTFFSVFIVPYMTALGVPVP